MSENKCEIDTLSRNGRLAISYNTPYIEKRLQKSMLHAGIIDGDAAFSQRDRSAAGNGFYVAAFVPTSDRRGRNCGSFCPQVAK